MSRNRFVYEWLELANAEDERRRRIRLRRTTNSLIRGSVDPFILMDDEEFAATFRLSKEAVRGLAEDLRPHLRSMRNDSLTPMVKILVALCFFACGSYQRVVGHSHFHFMSQPSVSRAIRQVTKALNRPGIFYKYVNWPMTAADRNEVKAGFYQKFGIPGVLGCIDGTHVVIVRPSEHEERYVCRKGYHTLNAMIICDANLRILCVDASSPGSTHDSRVWNNHPLCEHLQNLDEQTFLLGDSGYALRKTMMTPILDTNPGTPENYFYNKHVKARCTVERCIGVLKSRFRCLLMARALHYNPRTAANIVNACVVLHNIALTTNADAVELTAEEEAIENQIRNQIEEELTDAAENEVEATQRGVNPELQAGRALRRALVDRLWRDRNN